MATTKKFIKGIINFERQYPLELGVGGVAQLRAWPRTDFVDGCIVVCPFHCKQGYHYHGKGLGHRIAHCSDPSDQGYILSRYANQDEVASAMRYEGKI
jgi:hypothetical protein